VIIKAFQANSNKETTENICLILPSIRKIKREGGWVLDFTIVSKW